MANELTNLWTIKNARFYSFSRLNAGKNLYKHLKQPSFLSKALTNCFVNQRLIWRDGNIIFSLSTSGSLMMFSSPIFRSFLVGQHLFIHCCCFALLSHKHIKHICLVHPLCCPSKNSPPQGQHILTTGVHHNKSFATHFHVIIPFLSFVE